MDMPVAQQAKLIEALGPALQRARLRTKILGYDHNWSMHPDDIDSTPPGEEPETEYPTDLLRSRAARWIDGTAFHCYAGDPSRQTELQRAFPDKGIWFTECSGSHGPTDPPAQVFGDTLKWHTRNLVLGVTRNWGKTVVNWNLALDPDGGPHNGGCDTCTGVVTVGPGQTVTEQRRVLHARPPGPLRAAGRGADREHVVRHDRLERPDHGRRLPQPRRLDRAGRPQRERRSAQLRGRPGRLVVRVHAARRRARHLHLARLAGARRRPRPRCPVTATGEAAATAADDDATTRWTTGAAQAPGQSLQVDLGRVQRVRRVVLDTGADTGDFPRGYALLTSTDGTHWSERATGAGAGQLTTIDIPATSARFVRVVQTATAPQWWSVADLRVYR